MPDVKTTKQCIMLAYFSDIPVYLWGPTAAAKTSLVKQVAAESLKVPVISLFFQTQEPGDILGLPHVQIMYSDGVVEDLGEQEMKPKQLTKRTKSGKKVTSWAAPEWFQFVMENPKGGIIFGDEANRAQPDTAQTFTCLITERRFHVHEVPSTWKFVFASNYGSEYDVRELDVAIMARFCHLKVFPTTGEWLKWGGGKKATRWGPVNKKVLDFIKSSPSHLVQGEAKETKGWKPKPNRRTWEWVSHAIYGYENYGHLLDPERKESALRMVVQGLVGEGVHASLFTDAYIDIAAILKDPKKFDLKDINRFSRELIPTLIKTTPTERLYNNLKEILMVRAKDRRDQSFNIARSIVKSDEGHCEKWANMMREDKEIKKFYSTVRKEALGDEEEAE